MQNKEELIAKEGNTSYKKFCGNQDRYNDCFYVGTKIVNVMPDCYFTLEDCFEFIGEEKRVYNNRDCRFETSRDMKPFCTILTFWKTQFHGYLNSNACYYDRPYIMYFPFGSKFDFQLLIEIGKNLSILMDEARVQNDDERLRDIRLRQTQLLEIFKTGTSDSNCAQKIMKGFSFDRNSTLQKISEHPFKGDKLPFFDKIEEFEQEKKN